ncbi:MAG: DUF4168 domain-containing protein [Leptolyngbyaceae cyanobacterium RU_5_1]|nr:DUF4168 domain-containing protein [Leptolyngbyaceae cyanobacterium RU_5_1]
MIKRILVGCSLLAMLGMGSLPAHAQQKPSSPSTSPAAPQQTISDEELKKFINVAKQMPAISQERTKLVVQAVEKEGLSMNRFQEIYLFKRDSKAKPATQVTKDEEQKYDRVFAQLEQIQKDTQSKIGNAVQAEGLEVPRFVQILETVQKNPALQKKIEQMLRTGSQKTPQK